MQRLRVHSGRRVSADFYTMASRFCLSALEPLQGGFDSTLNLLLALLGGAELTKRYR